MELPTLPKPTRAFRFLAVAQTTYWSRSAIARTDVRLRPGQPSQAGTPECCSEGLCRVVPAMSGMSAYPGNPHLRFPLASRGALLRAAAPIGCPQYRRLVIRVMPTRSLGFLDKCVVRLKWRRCLATDTYVAGGANLPNAPTS